MNAYTEEATTFESQANTLIGVTCLPTASAPSAALVGVVVIVGGPQYRAGSHRQFVLLARKLASAGHPVLRFDYAGMGDSSGQQKDFEAANRDVASAVDHLLTRAPSLQKVVLWGLCDGASAALLYLQAREDKRIVGLCLLNPWVRSEATLARTQVKHYYLERLRQPAFWSKLLQGKVAVDAVSSLWGNLRLTIKAKKADTNTNAAQTYQQKMAMAWHHFGGELLLLLSGNDYTAKEFLEYTQTSRPWAQALQQGKVERHDLADADHTFSNPQHSRMVEDITLKWLQKLPR